MSLIRVQRLTNDERELRAFLEGPGAAHCELLESEGPLGFYAGYPTYLIRITPHIMITWVMMEWVQSLSILK